jgi:ABC-type transporter Mla MlaB component
MKFLLVGAEEVVWVDCSSLTRVDTNGLARRDRHLSWQTKPLEQRGNTEVKR